MADQFLTDTNIKIKKDLTWLQAHERLIIVFLVLLVGCWLGNKWLNNDAANKSAEKIALVQQLADQKEFTAQVEKQAALDKAQLNDILDQVTKQNAALAAAAAQRNVVLQAQQTKDQSLPLPELASRWKNLSNLDEGEIQASTTGITVTDSGARKTVIELEQVPVLQQNLKDQQTITEGVQKELDASTKVNDTLTQQVAGLKAQDEAQIKADNATIASLKADARKSKRNWFVKGLAIGAAVVSYLVIR